MKQNKVEFEITLKKHSLVVGETDEEIVKAVKRQAETSYYNSADSVTVNVTKIEQIE